MIGVEKDWADFEQRPVTVMVARHKIHLWGSNGWDGWLWLFSWVVKIVSLDQSWVARLLAGSPRLLSGTQEVLYEKRFQTRGEARDHADVLKNLLAGGEWPVGATESLPIIDDEWLKPTTKVEAIVRIAGIVGLACMAILLPVLGTNTPPPAVQILVLGAVLLSSTCLVGSIALVSRRRHGARGAAAAIFLPRNLVQAGSTLGVNTLVVRIAIGIVFSGAIFGLVYGLYVQYSMQ